MMINTIIYKNTTLTVYHMNNYKFSLYIYENVTIITSYYLTSSYDVSLLGKLISRRDTEWFILLCQQIIQTV